MPKPLRSRLVFRFAAAAMACGLACESYATAPSLDAAAARRMVDACVAHARSKGQSQAIAVVDEGGHLVALLRMDGNAPGVTEFAIQKAVAVAYWHFPTAEMENAAKATPGFRDAPRVVTVAGGVPVFAGDGQQFIGAVGVSGEAPSDDADCARAGIEAAGLLAARKPMQ